MVDIRCPNCGSLDLQPNRELDKALCLKCGETSELTAVNAWYKGTVLEMKNMEYDKNNA